MLKCSVLYPCAYEKHLLNSVDCVEKVQEYVKLGGAWGNNNKKVGGLGVEEGGVYMKQMCGDNVWKIEL